MKDKAFKIWVHMGSGEFDTRVPMKDIAAEVAKSLPDNRPLMVEVIEQGGWHLTYLFDGTNDGMIVGTANDMARFGPEQEQAIEKLRNSQVEFLTAIRRPAYVPPEPATT
ncbi:unnamed protein product [Sphagnum jensenii]|uniref:Uncharacterized protein n=1 Tax=Sphagnum jensenii TaxID=128206 RepID=A0ABP0VA04_9BRYO